MAKVSGLGDYLAVDNSGGSVVDISNDVTSITLNIGQDLIDITGVDKSARERLISLGDGTISLTGVFNQTGADTVFSTLSGTRTVTYALGGNTSGKPVMAMEMLISAYDLSRGTDGSMGWTANLSLQSGTVPAWSTV